MWELRLAGSVDQSSNPYSPALFCLEAEGGGESYNHGDTAMIRRGFSNIFSEKTFASNEQFNTACRQLRITQDVQLIYSSLHWLSLKTGYAWPSQSFLANEIGRSLRTVKSHIAKLKSLGLIIVKQRNNGQTALYYPLPLSEVAAHLPGCAQSQADGVNGQGERHSVAGFISQKGNKRTATRHDSAHLHNIEISTSTIPPKSPTGEEAEISFLKLWEVWPIQQAKKSARRIFMRLYRRGIIPSVEHLLRIVQNLKKYDRAWMNGKVAQLHRWLRDERWTDKAFKGLQPAPVAAPKVSKAIEPEFTPEEHRARSSYLELSVAVMTRRASTALDHITEKIVEGLGGLQRLRKKGMTCLPMATSLKNTEAYRPLKDLGWYC
ncbi:helix-turn-helix domain-containing protein [Desulfotalea psychrophila]|uniref:Helix-turn-helix domain-containing protein n=1 Tax=Desulfotalea psychrophila (strain LSv54 / DSM 12343) TaxID=177439 RepID=Q6AIC0_DESPS|nr:helix-turn-helix domain-containing protein [Desulfotalea psychrophila]CAG37927.1 hypothetical protein DPPB63 [Desulfotalea psychrophila LSv54]